MGGMLTNHSAILTYSLVFSFCVCRLQTKKKPPQPLQTGNNKLNYKLLVKFNE